MQEKLNNPSTKLSMRFLHSRQLITALLAFMLSSILGAIVAYSGFEGGVLSISLAIVILLILIAVYNVDKVNYWIFLSILFIPFILAIVLKLTSINLFGPWQLVLIGLAIFGIKNFCRALSEEIFLKVSVACFFGFLLIASFSSVSGRSQTIAALYQFISDLKPLLLLILGFAILWNVKIERMLNLTTNWFWLPALAFIAFEWVAPNLYNSIFPGLQSLGGTEDPSGIFPSRALGLFEHPSFLANISAFFAIISAARYLLQQEYPKKNALLVLAYLTLIIFAVQRQEMVACIASIMFLYLFADTKKIIRRLVFISLIGLLLGAIFWIVFSNNIKNEMAMWGIGTLDAITHPRAQIFVGAWQTALNYFPLGSGLGTYGGAGAAKFDDSLYLDLGFKSYWWFGKKGYLLDTYWPNSLAETGILGLILLFLSYTTLIVYALKKYINKSNNEKLYWGSAASALFYMLLSSPTSPSYQDPRLFLLPAVLIGIAYGKDNKFNA